MDWGIFSPDQATSTRRQQTLGLGSAVRHYNDRAVPGLGGLWYGMPMAWSLLGIWLAEELGRRPLPSANAVEALSMAGALAAGGAHMYRGSGRRKLAGRKDLSFGALSARGAYVTQPRRMGTVQPLVRLGFVEPAPQRFNLYQLSPVGAELLAPFGSEKRALLEWAKGSSAPTVRRLWPSERLPQVAASLLDRQLRQFGNGDDALRRRALLSSLPAATFAVSPLLEPRPQGNIDPEHWADLRSGVALIQLRNAAIALLARVEQLIAANTRTVLQPEAAVAPAGSELADLANAARVMGAEADTSPGREAHEFARVCMSSPASVILELARRDGAVVRLLSDGRLGLGSAGGTTMATVEEGVDGDDDAQDLALAEGPPLVPELPRVANLYALAGDVALDRTADQ